MAITLKACRVNKGLTQKQASEKLGVSPSTLFLWEKGKKFPNVEMIKAIEDLYGVKYADIIFLPNSMI